MNFIIREAGIEDAAGIARVHVETWQAHYRGQIPDDYLDGLSVEKRAERWRKNFGNFKPKVKLFVAEDKKNKTILGFCSIGPSRDEDAPKNTGEVYAIYTSPLEQGRGIGSALMQTGLEYLKGEDFKKATLWVLKTNKTSRGFYEAKGWQADGREKKDKFESLMIEETRYAMELV